MPVYHTRPDAEAYGRTVGILLPDARIPYIPGDPGNALSLGFAVIYGVVPGLTLSECSRFAPDAAERIADAARKLVAEGVRAIAAAGSCMLPYQNTVRSAVPVPVCLSPLVQLPLLASSLHASRPIGVLAADPYPPETLEAAGLHIVNEVRFASMGNRPAFAEAHQSGRLDSDALERETVAAAIELQAQSPELGAVILAAPVLAPYSAAVRSATRLPVTDALAAARYMFATTRQRAYEGAY